MNVKVKGHAFSFPLQMERDVQTRAKATNINWVRLNEKFNAAAKATIILLI